MDPLPVSQNWITRFPTYNLELAAKLSTWLERQPLYVKDLALLQYYFTKLGHLICIHNLQACQMFNMDEKEFLMGLATWAKVLCWRGRRNFYVMHDGKRELVTVIETVSSRGAALSLFVINKSKGYYLGWYCNLTDKKRIYHFNHSLKGWTNKLLALELLKDVFDPESRIVARIGKPQLLIFDGHGSHIMFPFIQFCVDHYIYLLFLPVYATHLLQRLDLRLFSP